MRAFLITAGAVFGLLVVVHIVRIFAEPQLLTDPWFWLITVVAAALSLWAWRLVWRTRQS
jgi:hypothetical protein